MRGLNCCSCRWPVGLVMLFSICSFILGLLPLHAGVPLAGKTWMPYAYILRYDYSITPRLGAMPEPSSFAILHIMNVCNGPGIHDCYKTHKGELGGTTLRQDGKAMSFLLTSLTVEVGVGVQTLATLYTILFRKGWLFFLLNCLIWWPFATLVRRLLPSLSTWISLHFGRFVVCLAEWKNALIRRYIPWVSKVTKSNFFVVCLALGSIASIMAAIVATTYIYKQIHAPGLRVTYSPVWLGMLWGSLPFTIAALVMEIIESDIERASSNAAPQDSTEVKPDQNISIEGLVFRLN